MSDLLRQDPYAAAREAAAAVARLTGVASHEIALVVGSGWLPGVEILGETRVEFDSSELPHFAAAAVAGHSSKIRSVAVGGRQVLVFLGRTHLYEGAGTSSVVHAVRTAAASGVSVLVPTNGCGSTDPNWLPGTTALIRDHINLTGETPLVGPRFVDMTDAYSSRLRSLASELDPTLRQGVYAQFRGPQYETPAEVEMARRLGADLVGMSTALETVAAREAGLEVLGLSLVTNLAAGVGAQPLNHEEVLAEGRASAARMGRLLSLLVPQL